MILKDRRIILFTFGDIPYDQRMLRIWKSLYSEGAIIEIFGRELFPWDTSELPYLITRYRPIFKKGPLAYLEYNLRAAFKYLFSKIELLYCADLDTMPAGYALRLVKKFKWLYDAHEYFSETPEVVRRPQIKKIWEIVADLTIPKIDSGITVSEGYSSQFLSQYSVNFTIIRNVPYRKDYNCPPKSDAPYLLYQGVLNEGRGLKELIAALENTEFQLFIAGGGDLINTLQEQVITQESGSKIHFCGKLMPAELDQFTQCAQIGINLLEHLGQSYYYSLANKFFDYIMACVPQLCINFPEYKLLNDKYEVAVLIPDLSVNSITEGLAQLSDADTYQRLTDNCKLAREELNWEKEETKLIGVFKRL